MAVSSTALQGSKCLKSSLEGVFLEPVPGLHPDFPPLTPFMQNVWRLNDPGKDPAQRTAEEAERFVYWFFDTFHRTRAPYHWPVPPRVLAWVNHPVMHLPAIFGQQCYLTRFMQHVARHYRQDLNVREPDDALRFLTWFALDCIPAWNLPRTFLPDALLPVLNQPVRAGLPLTAAMAIQSSTENASTLPDAELLAVAFEGMPKALAAGDPRLVPEFTSAFWTRRLGAYPDSVTAFEYLAARVGGHDAEPARYDALRAWFSSEYAAGVSGAAVFASATPPDPAPEGDRPDIRPPDRTVCIYRDHHTIAGLAKGGLGIREALVDSGVHVVDLDLSF
jgi:hypothetical protein